MSEYTETECRYDHHGHCDCATLTGLSGTADRLSALVARLTELHDRRHRPAA
jgi:hypothetical protein